MHRVSHVINHLSRLGLGLCEKKEKKKKVSSGSDSRHATTHLAIVHHSILDQHHHRRLLFRLGDRIVVLITCPDSQLGPIGTKRQRRDGRGVLGEKLHSFLGIVVPNGNETVRTAGSKRIVSIFFFPPCQFGLIMRREGPGESKLTWGGKLKR